MTAYVAVRPNALPVSMNSHMGAATAKLTPLVEEPGTPCATVDRQPRGPFSGALAAHGWSSSKAGYLVGSGASLCSFRDSAPIRRVSDGPEFATSTPFSKRKRGPVRRSCCVPSNPLQRALVYPQILFGAPLSVPELVR